MKYNELSSSARKSGTRVGRGISSGKGKTAGRGTKGQKSRAGSSRRPGFEGGQNPLIQRLPKLRGFTSHKTSVENVYTGDLDALGLKIDNAAVTQAGLVSNEFVSVKLIVKGEMSKKHDVSLQGASETAVAMIQKAGGSFKQIERVGRPKTSEKTSRKTTVK